MTSIKAIHANISAAAGKHEKVLNGYMDKVNAGEELGASDYLLMMNAMNEQQRLYGLASKIESKYHDTSNQILQAIR